MKVKRSLAEERMVIYRERNRNIRAMGFENYGEYLRSQPWLTIRATKLRIAPVCEACDKYMATEVHHMKYRKKDLEGNDLRWLVSICRTCHYSIEYENGIKLTPKMANAKLKRLQRNK